MNADKHNKGLVKKLVVLAVAVAALLSLSIGCTGVMKSSANYGIPGDIDQVSYTGTIYKLECHDGDCVPTLIYMDTLDKPIEVAEIVTQMMLGQEVRLTIERKTPNKDWWIVSDVELLWGEENTQ